MSEPVYIAIDPGTTQSAYIAFESPQKIIYADTIENGDLESRLRQFAYRWYTNKRDDFYEHLAIEMVASYGQPVGEEVFETCLWIGRFIGAFDGPTTKLKRHEIKMHLCHTIKGVNDSVIRQRLIDLYGGKEKAIGKKASPGPLHKFKKDEWQALALAYVWYERTFSDKMNGPQNGADNTAAALTTPRYKEQGNG